MCMPGNEGLQNPDDRYNILERKPVSPDVSGREVSGVEKKISKRKQQALAMRQHIKETAVGLFERYGFENVSMEEIAAAAGCSIGNIYHYFKSKDQLQLQVTDHVDEIYARMARDYAEDTEHSAMEQLLDFAGKSLVISAREAVLYKSFVHALSFPETGDLRVKPERVWFQMLTDFISACKAEGSIPADYPDEQILNSLVALHRGMLMQYRIEGASLPLEDWGRNMARAYLAGLSAGEKNTIE